MSQLRELAQLFLRIATALEKDGEAGVMLALDAAAFRNFAAVILAGVEPEVDKSIDDLSFN